MHRPVSIRYIAGCIALGCFVHVAAAETVAYSVTDLGALTDGAATGINERGDIVGDSFASRDMTDLGTLPGGSASRATGINARGDVIGYSRTTGGKTHAFLYPEGGHMIDLGALPGSSESEAWSINVHGDVVGDCIMADGTYRAFLYENGSMHDLNTLAGAGSGLILAKAGAISDSGQIVCFAQVNDIAHAVLLSPSGPGR
jgi:probable HAF family extracellular repeat protein